MSRKSAHWKDVYTRRAPTEVSWFQPEPTVSLELVAAAHMPVDAAVVDVGAGSSLLVDGLLERGCRDITLLDIAESAFLETRRRLGPSVEDRVRYIVSDVAIWTPERSFALWHDRAVFHFLTERKDRSGYRDVLARALAPGAQAIIGTFAIDGPERCSDLPVARYSAESLAAEFTGVLKPVEERADLHVTPQGSRQSFQFVRFLRIQG